jgi:hypothetical protein
MAPDDLLRAQKCEAASERHLEKHRAENGDLEAVQLRTAWRPDFILERRSGHAHSL